MTDPQFDGHAARAFKDMKPEERLEQLSREAALVWELRRIRAQGEALGSKPADRPAVSFLRGR